MKSIILFRHGKSDWHTTYTLDHNRPLNKRGKNSAKLMGKYLASINQIPEKIICSTSKRTKKTAVIAIKNGHWNINIEFNKNIYHCSARLLFSIAQQQNSKLKRICFVGHEPSFSTFIIQSTNTKAFKFPTAAMARIDFATNCWKDIIFEKGKLNWFIKPKDIC